MTDHPITCPQCHRVLAHLEWDAVHDVATVAFTDATIDGTHYCPGPRSADIPHTHACDRPYNYENDETVDLAYLLDVYQPAPRPHPHYTIDPVNRTVHHHLPAAHRWDTPPSFWHRWTRPAAAIQDALESERYRDILNHHLIETLTRHHPTAPPRPLP